MCLSKIKHDNAGNPLHQSNSRASLTPVPVGFLNNKVIVDVSRKTSFSSSPVRLADVSTKILNTVSTYNEKKCLYYN